MRRWSGTTPRIESAPPVMAATATKEPISMWSGERRWRPGVSAATPDAAAATALRHCLGDVDFRDAETMLAQLGWVV